MSRRPPLPADAKPLSCWMDEQMRAVTPDLTLGQVAEFAKIKSPSTIKKVLDGGNVSLETVHLLADRFGVTHAWLEDLAGPQLAYRSERPRTRPRVAERGDEATQHDPLFQRLARYWQATPIGRRRMTVEIARVIAEQPVEEREHFSEARSANGGIRGSAG